jgi:hypothetical protein
VKRHAAPIIAAILLLLPVLYVGSYFAQVMPWGTIDPPNSRGEYIKRHYRYSQRLALLYWPLEQIDRKVRPGAWEPRFLQGD